MLATMLAQSMSGSIPERLAVVQQQMASACLRADRDPASVKLVAVSKTFPAEDVMDASRAGHNCFGESRLQEAQAKIEQLPHGLEWHFIGRVQRNKVRKILSLFDTVHGIDSIKLAEHADRVAEELGLKPKVFLQINVGSEQSKGGFEPDQIKGEAAELAKLSHLRIVGLMCIPPAVSDPEAARPWFVRMRELQDELAPVFGEDFGQLSMGMSSDFEVAIEEGATLVRVGSAIFGGRI